MKLEVGMYVRTIMLPELPSQIRKIIRIDEESGSIFIDKKVGIVNSFYEKGITKASHNIIDLIEVGDYVNGLEVVNKSIWNNSPNIEYALHFEDGNVIENDFIKSIVTKEQFKQMEYEVK